MVQFEIETIDLAANNDVISTSNAIRNCQERQNELHRQSIEKLYQADRISLLSEIEELKASIIGIKDGLTNENERLQEQLRAIQLQVQKRENELLQHISTKDKQLKKQNELLHKTQTDNDHAKKQLDDLNNLLERERTISKDLQELVNENKMQFKNLNSLLEKERTRNTVIQTCLDSERTRSLNLEQALKHERLNVESREHELQRKTQLLQDITNKEQDRTKDFEIEIQKGEQSLKELQMKLHEEETKCEKLETELAKKNSILISDRDDLNGLITELRNELEKTKNENANLITSLDEERKVSEDLKNGMESLHGVNEQISEQEKLIKQLSNALENERKVNENLHFALDNNHENNTKSKDLQNNMVKELQMSLTAVQEQLQNQVEVVDQERNRVKRLRKERDIHEASALGARTKERSLELELEKEKAAREMEVNTVKDMLDNEIALKRNLEELLNSRTVELSRLSEELRYLKEDRKETPPDSPSKERLNILRHDLKSIADEHRVFLLMHKEYLEEHIKFTQNLSKVNGLHSQIQNLIHEVDGMKRQLGTVSQGSPIRLSPIKAAAYDRLVKQNQEMSEYLAKVTEEKSELRKMLSHLEVQVSDYRDRDARHVENLHNNKVEIESILTNERARASEERLLLRQTVETQKRDIEEILVKLREKEVEADEVKRSLKHVEEQLERSRSSSRRLQASETLTSQWTPSRIQKLYARYLRAEKWRKSLVYQKKYLLLLLGGFRDNETKTLATIAKMGAYPSFHEPKTRFSPAFTKFRTAVRVVVAAKRMKFLVCKSKKSVQLVMEPVSPSRTIPKKSEYNQGTPYIVDSSRFGINGSHRENGSTETGFLTEICNGNVQVFSPKQTDPGTTQL
ncbi:A-kinase anchor protein 9-like [Xenia sp. Carnegie-2017]|uniref:A-kinase anchor protein 9-like n=1 Tax=Xenia sp. Carnegie-2017 TaxID=2897299 RepID=UPI001F03DED8|nr:A-kinase anchor protein 9-like [Xenia sp. Carnegie-2017]